MIADSEDVFKSNTLHLPAIACFTEDELEIMGSRDGADSDLSNDKECEWVVQESRGAFDLFEDEFV